MEKAVIRHFEAHFQTGEYSVKRPEVFIPKSDGKLLDIGCGAIPTYPLHQFDIYALDIVRTMTRSFKNTCQHGEVVLGDAKMLPFRDASFEVIVANVLLHHLIGKTPEACLFNIRCLLQSLSRMLKRNGIVVIRELFVAHRVLSTIIFYVTLLCAKLGIEIEKLDIHANVITYFLSEAQFEKMLVDSDMQIVKKRLRGILFGRLKQIKNIEYCITSDAIPTS